MDIVELFTDGFGRVRDGVLGVTDGLGADALNFRPDPAANSIAWLVWHLTRVQDDHLADLAGREQAWTAEGFSERFALPFPDRDIGYGHSSQDVAAVAVDGPGLLTDYHLAVAAHTPDDLTTAVAAGLDRVIDESWDPPVTAGVRLVSVLNDVTQHIGQAGYVRGLAERHGG